MKTTIFFLTAVSCLTLPAVSHADTLVTKKKTVQNAKTETAATTPTRKRVVYYIGTEARTGSLIPTVVRSYDGRMDAAASPAVYGSKQIAMTGALDVGPALFRLDPSITLSRGGR